LTLISVLLCCLALLVPGLRVWVLRVPGLRVPVLVLLLVAGGAGTGMSG
jgi:hypothetical protein